MIFIILWFLFFAFAGFIVFTYGLGMNVNDTKTNTAHLVNSVLSEAQKNGGFINTNEGTFEERINNKIDTLNLRDNIVSYSVTPSINTRANKGEILTFTIQTKLDYYFLGNRTVTNEPKTYTTRSGKYIPVEINP